jgi:RHS repeat-associated protein
MPVTNYDTIDGEIIGECTGGVYTDYGVDALGSVIATIDSSAAVVNTYRFKPYGALVSKTGFAADPKFGWVGSLGYRATRSSGSLIYAIRRHYSVSAATWTSVDQAWPKQRQYLYCDSNPATLTDREGLWPLKGRATCFPVKNVRYDYNDCGQPKYYYYAQGVFCNPHPTQITCPHHIEGMTASWPNVFIHLQWPGFSCASDSGKAYRYAPCMYPKRSSINQPLVSETVECGAELLVSKNGVTINVTIISAGPAAPPRANALIDLTPTAARELSQRLGLAWHGCANFAVEDVEVKAA